MRASARKSYGEYKPVIVHTNGRTEIVGQKGRLDRIQAQTVFYSGPSEIWRGRRGVTFTERDDAVAYAQRVINRREKAHDEYMREYNARHG